MSITQYNELFLNYDEIKYGPHETIYEEDDNVDGIYLILKGKCLILKKKVINLSKNRSNGALYQNNFLTISNSNDNNINSRQNSQYNKSKEFRTLFAKNNKNNNALLTMGIGDIFGDLEINLNNNRREFTVKCENYNKTKVWFFSIDLIKNIIKNFKEISEQKYDIIRTRFEYANIVEKVKKENPINIKEIKIEDVIDNSKKIYSNFKPFQQKINICALQPNFNEIKKEKNLPQKNNKFLLTSRNKILNRKSLNFNKKSSISQPKTKLKLLANKPQNANPKNLISIRTENNYVKKVTSNTYAINEINKEKIEKIKNIKSLEKKIYLKRMNKKNAKSLFKFSNDDTF